MKIVSLSKYALSAPIIVAAWFGAIAGFLEIWQRTQGHMNPDVTVLAIVFFGIAFLALGVFLAGVERLLRWFPAGVILCYLLSTATFLDAATNPFSSRLYVFRLFLFSQPIAVTLALLDFKYSRYALTIQKATLPYLWLPLMIYVLAVPVSEHVHRWLDARELPRAPANTPNVIVIIVDTLRADHLSAYGYSRPTSPNVDLFAKEGVLFDNAIAPASWTTPSHASMLTGLYPPEHHTDCYGCTLSSGIPTIAEAFATRGYRTAAISANVYNFSRRTGLGRGFAYFPDYYSIWNGLVQTQLGRIARAAIHKYTGLYTGRTDADEVNQKALSWIDGDSRPFLLFVNYLDVHNPYLPPADFLRRFSDLSQPPPTTLNEEMVNGYSADEINDERDAYDACIAFVDSRIGDLKRELVKRGLENTVVVIVSDHGEGFNEHGLVLHGNSLYRELLHVPLIVWAPGRVPAGVRIEQPVSLTALPATLLQMVDGKSSQQFRGPSLVPLWTIPGGKHWPDPLSNVAKAGTAAHLPSAYGNMESITTSEWHYILGGEHGAELYDYVHDPYEQHNLMATADAKSVAEGLHQEMVQEQRQTAAAALGSRPAANGHAQDQLHTLGYVY